MCKECEKRGKTWEGSDPKCAFIDGVFTNDNWSCATMRKLREIIYNEEMNSKYQFNDDESIGIIPLNIIDDYGFVIIQWYKDRGATPNAYIVNSSSGLKSLTLDIAEEIIKKIK